MKKTTMKKTRLTIRFAGTPAQNLANFNKLTEALTSVKPREDESKKV